MSGDAWTTIESDPGVFTELIERLGVEGVQVRRAGQCGARSISKPQLGLTRAQCAAAQVDELYSLDEASLEALKWVTACGPLALGWMRACRLRGRHGSM